MGAWGPKRARTSPAAVSAVLGALRQYMPDRVATGDAICRQHANTLTWIENQPPDAVVWPQSTQDVIDIVNLARAANVPLIPFGAGTSLEGHVNAPYGGICLDFQRMDRIIAVNPRDLDCTVEAGVTRRGLNQHLRDSGLFFPVDPGAEEASLGGMAATRASGTNAVRYGTMRDNVLNITAVLADGSVVRTGGRARKSAAGYDLARLLVGSEGTLGIVTELSLRLYGVPEMILAAVCPFHSVEGACNATISAVQLGLGLARIELLDEAAIWAVNRHAKLDLSEVPTLFLEFHGTAAAARDQVDQFKAIAADEGARAFEWAERDEERRRLWKARHESYWAVRSAWPGKAVLATDVCVPISRLAACIAETQADMSELRLTAPILGHVGDGNFHTTPVFDPSDVREMRNLNEFLERLANRAIAMGGTCTGEHGIGQGKMKHLEAEVGARSVLVMREIKRALDPQGILNPGKIFSFEA